ncbi:MAG: hypothetical protein Q8O40_10870 [Chloroflexota bacterium]|nr:hypothetical protein [Chloroflexota bacterium]
MSKYWSLSSPDVKLINMCGRPLHTLEGRLRPTELVEVAGPRRVFQEAFGRVAIV